MPNRTDTPLRPPKTEDQKTAAREAMEKIQNERFEGSKNSMASSLGFSRNAVGYWFTNGYVGKTGAQKIVERFGDLELSDVRPDANMPDGTEDS